MKSIPLIYRLALCLLFLSTLLKLLNVEDQDQEAPMEQRRLARLREMLVPPAPPCPRMLEMESPGSLMTAKSLKRGKKRRAVMKRWWDWTSLQSLSGAPQLTVVLKNCHLTSNQDGSEAEEGDSSEMEEEEDTEEGEEDSEDEEEEMCLPGMDGKEEVCAEALLYLMLLHHRDVTRSAPAVCWMTTSQVRCSLLWLCVNRRSFHSRFKRCMKLCLCHRVKSFVWNSLGSYRKGVGHCECGSRRRQNVTSFIVCVCVCFPPQPGSDSGTTAVVALIRGKQLIVANAGDSRCVVSEKGTATLLSLSLSAEIAFWIENSNCQSVCFSYGFYDATRIRCPKAKYVTQYTVGKKNAKILQTELVLVYIEKIRILLMRAGLKYWMEPIDVV